MAPALCKGVGRLRIRCQMESPKFQALRPLICNPIYKVARVRCPRCIRGGTAPSVSPHLELDARQLPARVSTFGLEHK